MRRADLRQYDIRLITSLLGVFCGLTILFFIFLLGNYFVPQQIDIKPFLWSSYAIIAVVAGTAYFLTKQTKFEWVRLTGQADMIGKGKFPVEKGATYLIKEEQAADAVMLDAIMYKVPCLYVTRTNPDIVRQQTKEFSGASIIWLSEVGATNTVNPTEVEEMSYAIQRYMEKTGPSIIMFDGLAYMFNALPFPRVLHFIQDVRDHVAVQGAVLLFSLDPSIVSADKWTLLERELRGL
ncbi:DUF835 domain-containing protein [Candidatus Woesearchaeota archaeon]|nr:DUF835 domain-containing protein [Candidatus Woesearchaeota archaeon]